MAVSALIPEDAEITLILFGSPRDSATLSQTETTLLVNTVTLFAFQISRLLCRILRSLLISLHLKSYMNNSANLFIYPRPSYSNF